MAQVFIVASTPLAGSGLQKEQMASAIQTATARDIERSGALDLSDFLNRSLGSVHVNESQGNPLMMDVSYRGYTASPLLGTPQGLSVYMDGVRLNQPFGDVVLWDLIPKEAIASVSLMGGANPLFGLNTLGGALAIRTKDGQRDPGTSAEASAGSFGRRNLGLQHGGSSANGLDWLLIANAFREAGWRDDSSSRLGQLFGKLGWHDAQSSLKLTYAYARSKLNGNGLQEDQLIEQRRASVFTKPDTTTNHASFVNLEAQSRLSDQLQVSANAYYRNTRTGTQNGDLNDGSLGESVYYTGQSADRAWLAANGYGAPASESSGSFPKWRCIAQAGRNAEPNEKCTGLVTTTASRQQNAGLSAQLTFALARAGLPQPGRGRRRLRRQPRQLPAIVPVRLPQSRPLDHPGGGVRRWQPGFGKRLRPARRPRRQCAHLEPVRQRHAVAGHRLAPDAVGPLQPHPPEQQRPPVPLQ